jgi:hypothetical protein
MVVLLFKSSFNRKGAKSAEKDKLAFFRNFFFIPYFARFASLRFALPKKLIANAKLLRQVFADVSGGVIVFYIAQRSAS